jgi:hypothetical protein
LFFEFHFNEVWLVMSGWLKTRERFKMNPTSKPNSNWRWMVLAALALFAVVLLFSRPPISQDPNFHHFADTRTWMGLPNAADVLSNIPFLVIGVLGLFLVWKRRRDRAHPKEPTTAWALFFLGVTVTAFGSAYYHWEPNNFSLLWDRLPIAFTFMAFFSAMISERVHARTGEWLLIPLLLLGLGSVFYWYAGERSGAGDLRLYFLVQGLPLLMLPLILLLFPTRFSHGGYLWAAVAAYGLAKVFEILDHQIFQWGTLLSGHTLKHLLAAAGCFYLYRMLKVRQYIGSKKLESPPVAMMQ